MSVIWKYHLYDVNKPIRVSMPKGAKILAAKEQHGSICLWAIIEPDQDAPLELEEREFLVLGTGHKTESNLDRYIDTVSFSGGFLIWHVFEVTP